MNGMFIPPKFNVISTNWCFAHDTQKESKLMEFCFCFVLNGKCFEIRKNGIHIPKEKLNSTNIRFKKPFFIHIDKLNNQLNSKYSYLQQKKIVIK